MSVHAKHGEGVTLARAPVGSGHGASVCCGAVTVALLGLAGQVFAAAPQPIPHGTVASGEADIRSAWLAGPTEDYPHGVLGDAIEASALVVMTRDGQELTFRLSDGSVFEDTTPRLADIDGDGRDEVWTVRTDGTYGARLEAYGVVDGALVRRFATAPIGTGFRWLNPLGVADFDGDGQREAAYVETPHIGGVLTVVRPVGDRLEVVARRRHYSTHAMGSTRLDLGAIADVDGDGAVDVLVPVQSRQQFILLSLHEGTLRERWRSETVRIGGGVRLEQNQSGWVIHFSDGQDDLQILLPTERVRSLR